MTGTALQDQFAPRDICFGCGASNALGLQLKSFADADQVVATWTPQAQHQAFRGILNGGIIGTLLDCHCNWTAAWHFMQRDGLPHPPVTLTAEYTIRLSHPTAVDQPIQLRGWLVESQGRRAVVEGEILAAGSTTATCRGTFVAVKPGHPAFHQRS